MKMSKKSNDNITMNADDVADCGTITGGTPYMYGNWGVFHNINEEENNMMNLYEVYIIDTETKQFYNDKIIAQKDWTAIHEAWGNSGFARTLDDYKVETRLICSWPKKE